MQYHEFVPFVPIGNIGTVLGVENDHFLVSNHGHEIWQRYSHDQIYATGSTPKFVINGLERLKSCKIVVVVVSSSIDGVRIPI